MRLSYTRKYYIEQILKTQGDPSEHETFGHCDLTSSHSSEWQPDLWWPDAVRPGVFFPEQSCFHYLKTSSHLDNGFPALLPNWDLFRALWQFSYHVREYDAAVIRLKEVNKTLENKLQEADDTIDYHVSAIKDLQELWDVEPLYQKQIDLQIKEHEQFLEAAEQKESSIRAEMDQVAYNFSLYRVNPQKAQDRLLPLLHDLFGRLGTLPNSQYSDEPILVPVLEPSFEDEQGEVDYHFVDWPENTWNDGCQHVMNVASHAGQLYSPRPHDDPDRAWIRAWIDYTRRDTVAEMQQKHDAALAKARQASTNFENFRGTYLVELVRYTNWHRDRGADPNDEAETARIENDFGAVWLSKFQDVTREVVQTEQAFYEAEKKLKEAKQAAKMSAINRKYGEEPRDEEMVAAIPTSDEVANFGELLPSNKRKHIDDWLDAPTEPKRLKTNETNSEAGPKLSISEQSGIVSVWELAEGYQRRKIDDYIQQTQQAWQNTDAPAMDVEWHQIDAESIVSDTSDVATEVTIAATEGPLPYLEGFFV